ncbi:MAG: N-acetyltransferase [Bacteroidetes bacterium]|nr:N-acetyltransferase [Bacteroidota bacterium]
MLQIRTETPADYSTVEALVEAAFQETEYSDQQEHKLVNRLRKAPAFITELSIVADIQGDIVGHILLTPILIKDEKNTYNKALALAPVSVKPALQSKGIGGALIEESHQRAKKLGYEAIVLLGHEGYYPRFGYEPAHKFGVNLPFEAPLENCMLIELKHGALDEVAGMVEYPAAFVG